GDHAAPDRAHRAVGRLVDDAERQRVVLAVAAAELDRCQSGAVCAAAGAGQAKASTVANHAPYTHAATRLPWAPCTPLRFVADWPGLEIWGAERTPGHCADPPTVRLGSPPGWRSATSAANGWRTARASARTAAPPAPGRRRQSPNRPPHPQRSPRHPRSNRSPSPNPNPNPNP